MVERARIDGLRWRSRSLAGNQETAPQARGAASSSLPSPTVSLDDASTFDLLARWRAGDGEALGVLLARDLEWIRGCVHRQLGQSPRRFGNTDDFVQEAAMSVLRDGPRFVLAAREQFRALLAKIVVNVIRNKHVAQRRLKRDAQREQALASSVLYLDASRAADPQPDEAAEIAEQREWLRLGFFLLEPDDQQVLDLYWDGRSDIEIGAELGIAAHAAHMRRQRATERLTRAVLRLKQGRLDELLAGEATDPG